MAKETGDGISIQAQVDECLRFFEGLNVNMNQIRKRLMRTTGQGAVNAAKRNFSKGLRNRTGNLKKHIRYVLGTQSKYVKIYSDAQSDRETSGIRTSKRFEKYGITREHRRKARYGFMLAKGYDIDASSSWGLRFQIGDKWFTKHHIHVDAKDWLEPNVVRYANSVDLQTRLDKEFQKQIDYWEKRIVGKNQT